MVNISLISLENELVSFCLQPAHRGSSQTQLYSPANERKHAKFLTLFPHPKNKWLIGITVSMHYCLVSECTFMISVWGPQAFRC